MTLYDADERGWFGDFGGRFMPEALVAALDELTAAWQDAPIRVGNWTPSNYGGGYHGAVSLANALAMSINTVAVRLASDVGGPKIGELAHRFGCASGAVRWKVSACRL